MKEEEAVRQFLGDRPGRQELAEWREVLAKRLAALEQDRMAFGAEGDAALDRQIAQLRRQVEALREEEAITEFVEDSVRVTLQMGSIVDQIGDLED